MSLYLESEIEAQRAYWRILSEEKRKIIKSRFLRYYKSKRGCGECPWTISKTNDKLIMTRGHAACYICLAFEELHQKAPDDSACPCHEFGSKEAKKRLRALLKSWNMI